MRDRILGGVIILLLILFVFRECQNQSNTDDLVLDITNYSDSAKYYKGKNGTLIAYNKTLNVENEKQLKAVLSKYDTLSQILEKFKDIKSTTIIKETITIKHDSILFEKKIPCDFEPFKVKRDSLYYTFRGTIGQDFFSIDTLSIPNQQSIVVGRKKVGFLKHEYRAEVINSNPLVNVTNIGSYAIKPKKKWYEKRIVQIPSAFLIGFLGGKASK